MADVKQLKTITIDGVTFGMQEGLGGHTNATKTITNFPTSWSWTNGASITIPKGDSLLVRFEANIPTATSSGSRVVAICVSVNGSQSWFNKFTSADAAQCFLQGMGVVYAENSDVTLTVQVATNKAVTGNSVVTGISAVKLLVIPNA